ncbi:MAG: protein kinase, partial [Gemmatimonadales bacterium]
MPEITSRLKNALADRYAIHQELGAGGMATVYLAEDLKHHRQVAVKVLRPELAATLGPERFVREIEIAANLTHPHILMLIDSGEADGFLYYVMPYIEGESLRERLDREGQLPLDDVLTITSEVAGALAYAHDHGVVHRDIKPANIMLSGGQGIVADFGIARAVSAAGGEELTRTGMAVGTPLYMSPEQAAGADTLDGRSDIYALGCVVYEMLAGEPPFSGPSAQAIIARHAIDTPHSLRAIRTSLPNTVEAAIIRALGKAPVDRFQTAGEFATALREKEIDALTGAARLRNPIAWVTAVAVVFLAAIVGVISLGTGTDVSVGPPRLAVLPIENLGAPEDENFADGMTEEIQSRLAEIRGLRVVSRTSAKRFKGSDAPISEIGAALQVEYVLESTVRTDRGPSGSAQVLVTSRLIRTSDDTDLWTDSYGAKLVPGEVFGVQAEIAEQVAAALNVTLSETEREAVRAVLTEDSVA